MSWYKGVWKMCMHALEFHMHKLQPAAEWSVWKQDNWVRGKNIASSFTPAHLFRSYHVWAHCSASDRLHASSLQSEEEEQEENKFVCLSTLSLTIQITVFVSNVISHLFSVICYCPLEYIHDSVNRYNINKTHWGCILKIFSRCVNSVFNTLKKTNLFVIL